MDILMTEFAIVQVSWQSHQSELMALREQVFVIEQCVPLALEWDGLDDTATHLLAMDAQNHAIGCARILSSDTIGRMAVLQHWQGFGVGRALLNTAVDICKAQGTRAIKLSAQKHALSFYAQAGFVVSSADYMDANILHCDMKLHISD